MMIRTVLTAAASAALLAACGPGTPPASDPAPVDTPAEAADEADAAPAETAEAAADESDPACPIIESANWTAWIDRMPGPDAAPTLNVYGDVTVPTPGFTYAWREGPTDRSAIPSLRLILEPTPPDGLVLQALTTEEVSYQGPALPNGYSRIFIVCAGEPIAEITEIEDVQ